MADPLQNRVVYEIEAPRVDSNQGRYIIVPEKAAAGWELQQTSTGPEVRPDLLPLCRDAMAQIEFPRPLGRGSERELRRRLDVAMAWARRHYQEQEGPFEVFAPAVARVALRRFLQRLSRRRLILEAADDRVRDKALDSEAILVAYLGLARSSLERVQRVSLRFGAAAEKGEDLLAETVARIIEIVRRGRRPFPFAKYERPGLPAFVSIYDEVRAAERRRRRIVLAGRPLDLPVQAFPSPEELLLAREARAQIESFPSRLASRLTRKQQAWLDALLKAADEGDNILTRAALDLGLHKSQATRAAARIASVVRRHRLVEGAEPKKGK